ncbi:MAG: caspase family protein [Actinomycetota bacterium]|nr:caspase family protein [Actinomycetota bacterium]
MRLFRKVLVISCAAFFSAILMPFMFVSMSRAKMEYSPNMDWHKTFGGSLQDEARCVCQTSDGGYIITGRFDFSGAGSDRSCLIKTDNLGNLVWQRTFGGESNDCAYSVQQTTDGGYVLARLTWTYGSGSKDAWLVKTVPYNPQDYYAVIVGVDNYDASIKTTLGEILRCMIAGASGDAAREMKNTLLKDAVNWKDENIKLLCDSPIFNPFSAPSITRKDIRNAVDWMNGKADSNDICLFYFSGHGGPTLEIENPDHYEIYPGDVNGIAEDELGGWLRGLPMEKVIVLLDSCRSGGFLNDTPGKALNSNYFNVFAATGAQDVTVLTCFTKSVISALNGDADGCLEGESADGWITTAELGQYLEDLVSGDIPRFFSPHIDYYGGRTYKIIRARSKTFFGEGTTRANFEEFISLQNPNDEDTQVELTFMFGAQPSASAASIAGDNLVQEVSVPAKSRVTLNVADLIGDDKDVSTMVESKGGPINAERPMYFNYNGMPGGHASPGLVIPSTTFFFAEGTTRAGFDQYLCLQNPNDEDSQATITYMLGTGENKTVEVVIPRRSRVTVRPIDTVGPEQDVSTSIESSVPIIAERPMYFRKDGWIGGHCCLGETE